MAEIRHIIPDFRDKYPEYNDMTDDDLLDAIHQAHYSDMPREQFRQCCCDMKPNHDDLETAAVSGEDSLDLQDMNPTVKPTVKMTLKELEKHLGRINDKITVILDGVAYIIDPQAIDPQEAIEIIFSGDDSAILGYPQRGQMHVAVTKQGDIITDLPTMRRHALTKNVQWACCGEYEPLMEKARRVAEVIKSKRSQ